MNESFHPAWRSLLSGYSLPPLREVVWGWDGREIHQVALHEEAGSRDVYWADLYDRRVGAISHWMPLAENPDQPPRPPDRWANRHDGLSQPPQDSSFVWVFIGDDPPRRAQYIDDHWLDLDGQLLDARGLKWLRDLEYTDALVRA